MQRSIEEERPERADDAEAVRDGVHVATSRCPYCHDDVERETADVCRDCLARHHGACWSEGKRCGACGSGHVLRPVRPDLTPARVRELTIEALRRQGYPDHEIERVIPPPPDRCPFAGCAERGVARGNATPHFYCPTHAAVCRLAALKAALIMAALGGVGVVGSIVAAILADEPEPLLASIILGPLFYVGWLHVRMVRTFPPLPPSKES